MVISKLNINRLGRLLKRQKWTLLAKLRLNNLKFNWILRATNDSEIGKTRIKVNNLSLSEKDYMKFVNFEVLIKYNQLGYLHFQPVE
ncbi:MAG: hypothetical protein ACYTXL_24360 [Nostoc sp.]